jgi:sortase A
MYTYFLFTTRKSVLLALLTFTLLFISAQGVWADEPVSAMDPPRRLVISAISLDSEIMAVGWRPVLIDGKVYGQWETANNVVGWHNLSARPGQVGNTVLAGHSDINAQVFRNLKDVEIGDEVVVFAGEQTYHYVVTQKFLVKEKGVSLQQRIENASWIAPTQDERLTLVTCANLGATHRLIIVAMPVTIATQ